MPAISSTFDSQEPFLAEVLREIHAGKIQLPDFQRPWVWDDIHIRSLLASVSLAYPIGAVMFLEVGGAEVRFRPRLVEGVKLWVSPAPDRLILDGQQRLTSRYGALYSRAAVVTRDEKQKTLHRVYYFDIAKCLDPEEDRLDAVVSLFEMVNTGGVALTVFELITATFAAEDFQLRDDWNARRDRLHKHDVLKVIGGTEFLQAVTLLASYRRHRAEGSAVSVERKDVLRLSLSAYKGQCRRCRGGSGPRCPPAHAGVHLRPAEPALHHPARPARGVVRVAGEPLRAGHGAPEARAVVLVRRVRRALRRSERDPLRLRCRRALRVGRRLRRRAPHDPRLQRLPAPAPEPPDAPERRVQGPPGADAQAW